MKTAPYSVLTIAFLAFLLCFATEAPARTYSTNFPFSEDPLSERGSWINGGTIGIDWKDFATMAGMAYGKPDAVTYDDGTAILSGTWGADQMVTATIHSVNQTDSQYQELELRLRTSIAPHSITGYEINFRCSKSSNAYMEIVRWNGPLGNFTYLARYHGSQYGVTEGDVVRATIIGNTITVYINGVQRGTATDSAYSSGAPGIGTYGKTSSNARDYGFTNFTASDGLATLRPLPPRNLRVAP